MVALTELFFKNNNNNKKSIVFSVAIYSPRWLKTSVLRSNGEDATS